jgi:hypothetical protein
MNILYNLMSIDPIVMDFLLFDQNLLVSDDVSLQEPGRNLC